jgi:hypothetical protein
VDETKFLIDVDDMNVGGTNKVRDNFGPVAVNVTHPYGLFSQRRRSMLPKVIPDDSYGPRNVTSPMSTSSHEPGDESAGRGDQSMDASSSCEFCY